VVMAYEGWSLGYRNGLNSTSEISDQDKRSRLASVGLFVQRMALCLINIGVLGDFTRTVLGPNFTLKRLVPQKGSTRALMGFQIRIVGFELIKKMAHLRVVIGASKKGHGNCEWYGECEVRPWSSANEHCPRTLISNSIGFLPGRPLLGHRWVTVG